MFRAAFLPFIRSSLPCIGICTFYADLMTVCYQEQDGMQFHPAPGSKRTSNLHKMYQCRCTAKNSWWWAEMPPETCRVVIPIKLEFSASVGFIYKEFVTMHGHTILQNSVTICYLSQLFLLWWPTFQTLLLYFLSRYYFFISLSKHIHGSV